jgi:hypothetical protein
MRTSKRLDARLWPGGSCDCRGVTAALQWAHMIEQPAQVRVLHLNRSGDRSSVASDHAALQNQPDGHPDPSGPVPDGVVCRKLRARDVRHLVSNNRLVHVEQPDSLIDRSGPLGVAVRGLRPFNRMRPITNLAFTPSDRFLAFAQFRQSPPDRRWTLTGIGLANGLFAPEEVVEELLSFSVIRAGHRGVKRLFVRAADDCPVREAFNRVGFERYMGEEVFLLDGAVSVTRECGQMREQEPTDTWAVHQLYHAAVPREVQFAEAWTSHQWDLPHSKRQKHGRRSFVLEDGHQIGAYARVRTGAKAASIEVMYLPDYRHALESFCGAVIYRTMRDAGAMRVFIPVRSYQSELVTVLGRMGLVCVGRQDLLVKYTTAKVVTKPSETVILAPADVRERVPERVPTFLNRRPGGEPSA